MRLLAVEIEGFRAYRVAAQIELDDFTVFAGRNDAGKSSVFAALRMFLDGAKPEVGDFSVGGTGTISVTCTFGDLPSEIVIDESAITNLEEEHLLDRNGNLCIRKSWFQGRSAVEVLAIARHPFVEEVSPLIGLKQAQLKTIAMETGALESVEDKRINASYRRAIWSEWNRRGLSTIKEVEVPLNAEDGKQVAQALQSYFPMFQLFESDRAGSESDQVAQDPAKVIVKTVLDRHTERLAGVAREVQDEITELLHEVVVKLADFAPDLASELLPSDLEPSWQKAFSAIQFVDGEGVSLTKRGSGTRRLVLLSFFRAEAERGYQESGEDGRRGLIIAVEEPETALHPDLQREALRALLDVAGLSGRQVILTTHSSNLIREVPIESVRFLNTTNGVRSWASSETLGNASLLERLNQTMGTFTDHNVRQFILVEGRNDIAGLLALSDGLQEAGGTGVVDLRQAELRGELCFIPIGGCGAAALWESRLSPFGRKELHVLDSDKSEENAPLKLEIQQYANRFSDDLGGRATVHVLARRELENYLTTDAVLHAYSTSSSPDFARVFRENCLDQDWNYLDIPMTVAKSWHQCASEIAWEDLSEMKQKSKESAVKKRLADSFSHPTVAAAMIADNNDLMRTLVAVELAA